MGPDVMILAFWMLGFKPTFSLFSFLSAYSKLIANCKYSWMISFYFLDIIDKSILLDKYVNKEMFLITILESH